MTKKIIKDKLKSIKQIINITDTEILKVAGVPKTVLSDKSKRSKAKELRYKKYIDRLSAYEKRLIKNKNTKHKTTEDLRLVLNSLGVDATRLYSYNSDYMTNTKAWNIKNPRSIKRAKEVLNDMGYVVHDTNSKNSMRIYIMKEKPKVTKPKATKPKVTKGKITKPKATKPKVTKGKITKPKATKGKATKPKVTKGK